MNNKTIKVAEDVAIADVKAFVEYFTDNDIDPDSVKDKYPKTVKAVMTGLLNFGDDGTTPAYTLDEPLLTTEGSVALDSLTFNTRVTLDDQKQLSTGINMKKDAFDYGLKTMAFIAKQPTAMVRKFGRFDQKFIEEFHTIFL